MYACPFLYALHPQAKPQWTFCVLRFICIFTDHVATVLFPF